MTSTTPKHDFLLPASLPTWSLWALAVAVLAVWVLIHMLRRMLGRQGWPWQVVAADLIARTVIGAAFLALLAQAAARVLVLATPLPIWLIALGAAVAVEGALWLYRLERDSIPRVPGAVLGVLRAALVLAVAAMLAQPVLAREPTERLLPQVAVLVDESLSMYVPQAQLDASERIRLAEALGRTTRPVRLDERARALEAVREQLALQGDILAALGEAAARVRASRLAANRDKLVSAFEAAAEAVEEHLEALGGPLQARSVDPGVTEGVANVRKALRGEVASRLDEAIQLARKADADELVERHERLLAAVRHAEAALGRLRDALVSLAPKLDEAYYRELAKPQKEAVDAVASTTRYELARQILTRPGGLLEKLSEDYDVRLYTFAERTRRADARNWAQSKDSPTAADLPEDRRSTDVAGALKTAISEASPDRLVGVILVGDGGHNASEDPRVQAQRLANLRAKLCAVVAGGALPPRDAAVITLEGPETICVRDKLRVTADVKLDGLAGQKVRAALTEGKRAVETRTLEPTGTSWRSRLEFTDTPQKQGTTTYKLAITPCEGEALTTNNAATLTVSVTPDRTKLLIVEGRPRWEFRYLKNLFASRDRNVRLQYVLIRPDRVADAAAEPAIAASASRPPTEPQATLPPADVKEWLKFDVVVLGDVPPAALDAKAQEAVSKFVNDRGGTLIVISGPSYMPHAYAGTPMADLLPVAFTQALPPLRDPGFQLSLTEAGKASDIFAVASGRRRDLDVWESLPKLYWRHRLVKAKLGATTLAYALVPQPPQPTTASRPARSATQPAWKRLQQQQRENSLVTVHNVGWGKVMFLAFDRTWRMRYRVGDRYHHRFWGQVMRWATAGKLPAGTNLVKIGTDRRRYEPQRRITVRAQLLKNDLSPVVGSDVHVKVFRRREKDNEEEVLRRELSYLDGSPGMYAGQLGPLPAGVYRVELDAPAAKASLAGSGLKTVSMEFFVEASSNLEQAELGPDRARLSALTSLTDGRVEELASAANVRSALSAAVITRQQKMEFRLWQSWPLLGLIVLLGAGEWLLRKKEGLP